MAVYRFEVLKHLFFAQASHSFSPAHFTVNSLQHIAHSDLSFLLRREKSSRRESFSKLLVGRFPSGMTSLYIPLLLVEKKEQRNYSQCYSTFMAYLIARSIADFTVDSLQHMAHSDLSFPKGIYL